MCHWHGILCFLTLVVVAVTALESPRELTWMLQFTSICATAAAACGGFWAAMSLRGEATEITLLTAGAGDARSGDRLRGDLMVVPVLNAGDVAQEGASDADAKGEAIVMGDPKTLLSPPPSLEAAAPGGDAGLFSDSDSERVLEEEAIAAAGSGRTFGFPSRSKALTSELWSAHAGPYLGGFESCDSLCQAMFMLALLQEENIDFPIVSSTQLISGEFTRIKASASPRLVISKCSKLIAMFSSEFR